MHVAVHISRYPGKEQKQPSGSCLTQCRAMFICLVHSNIANLVLYIPVVIIRTYVPPGLTFVYPAFCPHSVFVCFVWVWEQTAIISLYSINWLVCITETECLLRGTDWIFIYNSTFCPHSVFMCFMWISEQTAIISLYSINWLVCITETEYVYFAVRTGCLFISRVKLPAETWERSKQQYICQESGSGYRGVLSLWRVNVTGGVTTRACLNTILSVAAGSLCVP